MHTCKASKASHTDYDSWEQRLLGTYTRIVRAQTQLNRCTLQFLYACSYNGLPVVYGKVLRRIMYVLHHVTHWNALEWYMRSRSGQDRASWEPPPEYTVTPFPKMGKYMLSKRTKHIQELLQSVSRILYTSVTIRPCDVTMFFKIMLCNQHQPLRLYT